jgi:hypothetical protein
LPPLPAARVLLSHRISIAWVSRVFEHIMIETTVQINSIRFALGWGLDDGDTPCPFLEREDYEEVKPVTRVVKPAPPKLAHDKNPPQKKGVLWGVHNVADLDEICFLE